MPETKKTTPTTPAVNYEQLLTEHDRTMKDKLNKRYQDYVSMLNGETNIARRYEIKERLEELTTVFHLLFD